MSADDLPAHLADLNADVTARCEAAGRDPESLGRSVLLLGSLDPCSAPGRLTSAVEQALEMGYEEIVVFSPWDARTRTVFESDAPQDRPDTARAESFATFVPPACPFQRKNAVNRGSMAVTGGPRRKRL